MSRDDVSDDPPVMPPEAPSDQKTTIGVNPSQQVVKHSCQREEERDPLTMLAKHFMGRGDLHYSDPPSLDSVTVNHAEQPTDVAGSYDADSPQRTNY